MTQSILRFGAFLLGLAGLRGIEVLAPDHAPTAALGPRWRANLTLGVLNGGLVSLACGACLALTASGAFPAALAPLRLLPASPWIRIPVELLLLDLIVYLLHRAYHVVPLLWRLHLVHHTDLDLDVSSASRFHAGEVLVSSLVKVAAVALLGISPVGLVTFETLMLFCAQLQHANIRIPARVEGVLWWTLVPPAMHRIHHTPVPADTGSNFGTILTLWDALLGTLRRRPALASPSFGVSELREEKELGRIPLLLLLPFRTDPRSSGGP